MSTHYFIKSKLDGNVIDIQGASTKAGVGLDAYPQKMSGNHNQLWTVVDGTFPSVVETMPAPLEGCSGSGNYILANGSSCAKLTGVKATILFTEDLVWKSADPVSVPGFSIQLNAAANSIGHIGGTGETSNIDYGALAAKPGELLSQAFGVVPDSAQVRQAKPNARKLTAQVSRKRFVRTPEGWK